MRLASTSGFGPDFQPMQGRKLFVAAVVDAENAIYPGSRNRSRVGVTSDVVGIAR